MGAKKCLGLLSACCVAFVVMATVSMVPPLLPPPPIAGVVGAFIATLGNACSVDVGTKVVSVGVGVGVGGGGGERAGVAGGGDVFEYLRCENGDCKL